MISSNTINIENKKSKLTISNMFFRNHLLQKKFVAKKPSCRKYRATKFLATFVGRSLSGFLSMNRTPRRSTSLNKRSPIY